MLTARRDCEAMKHPILFLNILLLTALLSTGAVADERKRVGVKVGGDTSGDMCGGYGTLTEEISKKTGTVSVHSGPSENFAVIDHIPKGNWVSMCDENGPWEGIVYTLKKEVDCGVGTPLEDRQEYTGKCKSGWILRKHIGEFAG